jgi:hypothetical protein
MLTRNKILAAIKESTQKAQHNNKEYFLFGRIYVFIKDPVLPEISIKSILDKIESIVPMHMMEEIDEILIGSFPENEERQLEAHYNSGALFVSNALPTEYDYLENIVHETAHSLEGKYGLYLYGDKTIELEFLGKRTRLFHILKQEGYNVSREEFEEVEYSEGFDNLLYQEIGYDTLNSLVTGLFISPYGATSLREYFANGFEEYFLGDRTYLMNTSVKLYQKITELIKDEGL